RKRSVQMVFDLLSCALGPLTREDILHLMPKEAGFNFHILREAIKPLDRFVVGDGQGQGYVFSHPRLREHFCEMLSERDRCRWERRFTAYGQGTIGHLKKGLTPKKVSHYVVEHYGDHLVRSGSDLHMLEPLASDVWRRAWLVVGGYHGGFLADVEKVWKQAEKADARAWEEGIIPPHLGTEIRCALIVASELSVARNLSAFLLIALVKNGLWPANRAIAYARVMNDPAEQAECYAAVAELVPSPTREDLFAEAIGAIDDLEQEADKARLIAKIVPYLADPLQQTTVLTHVGAIPSESWRARALTAFAGRMTPSVAEQAIGYADRLAHPDLRRMILCFFAEHLPKPTRDKLIEQMLGIAGGEETDLQAARLAWLGPCLPDNVLETACKSLVRCWSDRHSFRNWGLTDGIRVKVGLLPRGTPRLDAHALCLGIPGVDIELLRRVARQMPIVALHDCLTCVQSAWPIDAWANGFTVVAPFLPRGLLRKVLDSTKRIKEPRERGRALAALSCGFPEKERKRILRKAVAQAQRTLGDADERAQSLAALVAALPASMAEAAFATITDIVNGRTRNYAILRYIPRLPDVLIPRAIELLNLPPAILDRSRAAAAMAQELDGRAKELLVNRSLNAITRAHNEDEQAGSLCAMMSTFSEKHMQQAFGLAVAMRSEINRSAVLSAMVSPRLSEPLRGRVLWALLAAADGLPYEGSQARVLQRVGPLLRGSLAKRAFEQARRLTGAYCRAVALASILPSMDVNLRKEASREMLVAVRERMMEGGQVVFDLVNASLSEAFTSSLLEIIEATKDDWVRAQDLAALVPVLRPTMLRRAIAIALTCRRPESRATACVSLVPRMDGHDRQAIVDEARKAIRQVTVSGLRAKLLVSIAADLSESGLADALRAIEVSGWSISYEMLRDMAPYLCDSLWPEAISVGIGLNRSEEHVVRDLAGPWSNVAVGLLLGRARRIADDVNRAETLAELALKLPEQQGVEVLRESVGIAITACKHGEAKRALRFLRTRIPGPMKARIATKVFRGLSASVSNDLMKEWVLYMRDIIRSKEARILWRKTLRLMAQQQRRDLIMQLADLAPALGSVGGQRAAAQIAQAIMDVGRWWS
ncbi:MAG TPA: hypothetical protein VM163_05220, partial [bacterium]|nr:hypothetical protein [bacterium]